MHVFFSAAIVRCLALVNLLVLFYAQEPRPGHPL